MFLLALGLVWPGQTVVATDSAMVVSLMARARPGSVVLLAPGEYKGGIHIQGVHGQPGQPIVIRSQDAKRPARFIGGGSGVQLSAVSHVVVQDIVIEDAQGNGLNIDDGGKPDPSHHVTIKNITVRRLPAGNRDAIKLSGLDDFTVENCRVEQWGGSGIDMVGCHRGKVTGTAFVQGGDSGIQAKGGSSEIQITGCTFRQAGQRSLNLGGSTGMQFFRPAVAAMPPNAKYEAKNITVTDCLFVGAVATVAFVGVDGAVFSHNTVSMPDKWFCRILQETNQPGFVPSRNGVVERNIVVFASSRWAEGGTNIGPGTAPQTFRFSENFWFCADQPARSRPNLPTPEQSGVYGQDPRFANPAGLDFRPLPGSLAVGYGQRTN